MSKTTRNYINAPLPDYTYVLRWWLKEPGEQVGTQSQVLVVRSDHPLLPSELLARVEAITHEAALFQLVDLPRNTAAKLDTWEPIIEFCGGPETVPKEIPERSEWWHDN